MDAVLIARVVADSDGVEISSLGKANAELDGVPGISSYDLTKLLNYLSKQGTL